jgi:hypothetical protein
MECPPAAHAACLGDGMCTLVVGAEPCPPGYLDVSGICFRFGILSR